MLLLDDLRQAWRGLRHAPGFLAVAGSVLALGLGATIFMYGVINTTLLKGPPFEDGERLIGVRGAEPARDNFDDDLQYLDYVELRDQQRTLEDLMGFYTGTMIVSGEGLPERYSGGFVTWNFFDVLRVKPLLGRAFNESDAVPNAAPVVILNYDLWRTRYNRDPNILGRTLRVNSRPSTVVGVAPEGFVFPSREALWIPIVREPRQSLRAVLHDEARRQRHRAHAVATDHRRARGHAQSGESNRSKRVYRAGDLAASGPARISHTLTDVDRE